MTVPGAPRSDAGVIDVEGARLRYRIEGLGQACLVVGSSILYPRAFSDALREQLRLVFVDLRHFVASDPSFGPDRISLDTYADDIERVRSTLGLDDIVVIGHSIHGAIALEYARRYPDHVRGVVAIGARARMSAEDYATEDRLWEAEASEERKAIVARRQAALTPEVRATLSPAEAIARDYVAIGPMQWFDPTYDPSWLWEGVVPNQPILDRLYDELFDPYDLAQGPSPITVPVLIAIGRYDYTAPHTLWEEHRHKLSRHTFALFERSGHYPSLDEPKLFDHTLLAWIQSLKKPGS